jgi:hypothetical protein
MTDEGYERTQETTPKGHDKDGKPYAPIEIPIPERGDVMDFLEKAAKLPDPDRSRSRVPDQPNDDGQRSEDH